MKLTPEQINQIIEGLENPLTKLECFNPNGFMCNTIKWSGIDQKYNNKTTEKGIWVNPVKLVTKDEFIKVLSENKSKCTFELVTKVITETRTKI